MKLQRAHITVVVIIALATVLVACGEKKEPAENPKPATPAPADTQPAPAEPQVLRRPGITFEDSVHDEYSYEAVKIPTRVSDSILRANKMDPRKIEKEMTAYLHRQDSLVRQALADKYSISLDSLNTILKKKQAER